MGLCGSSMSEDEKAALDESRKMDRVLTERNENEARTVKLLLLGTGESGKSTIFKQMQIIYQSEDFTDYEKSTYRDVVRRNVVESMQSLLFGCEKFGFELKTAQAEEAKKFILSLDPLAAAFWVDQIVPATSLLWQDVGVQQAYDNRAKMQLIDSASYFLDSKNLERIGRHDYTPSRDDILRARLRTSGIVERTFMVEKLPFKFLDVGGQRNERRKWIHCFDSVTAVIFVAAVSEYDQMLYEDENENRLTEAVRVFEEQLQNKYFFNSAIILFLNKIDLFKEKIPRVPIENYFPDYSKHKGNNTFNDAYEFMKNMFLATRKVDDPRLILCHPTQATDTENVKMIFHACKATILQRNLDQSGLGHGGSIE